jgi:hypothetical protein
VRKLWYTLTETGMLTHFDHELDARAHAESLMQAQGYNQVYVFSGPLIRYGRIAHYTYKIEEL